MSLNASVSVCLSVSVSFSVYLSMCLSVSVTVSVFVFLFLSLCQSVTLFLSAMVFVTVSILVQRWLNISYLQYMHKLYTIHIYKEYIPHICIYIFSPNALIAEPKVDGREVGENR